MKDFESVIENEKEWRRYMIERVNSIEDKLSKSMAWALTFRIVGSGAFALLIVWIEAKLNN